MREGERDYFTEANLLDEHPYIRFIKLKLYDCDNEIKK